MEYYFWRLGKLELDFWSWQAFSFLGGTHNRPEKEKLCNKDLLDLEQKRINKIASFGTSANQTEKNFLKNIDFSIFWILAKQL